MQEMCSLQKTLSTEDPSLPDGGFTPVGEGWRGGFHHHPLFWESIFYCSARSGGGRRGMGTPQPSSAAARFPQTPPFHSLSLDLYAHVGHPFGFCMRCPSTCLQIYSFFVPIQSQHLVGRRGTLNQHALNRINFML